MTESTATCDVLVVGAGPAGLTAVHELARFGLSVRLIDAADGPATTSRALGIHARTLETFDQMGVLQNVLSYARRIEHFTIFESGCQLVRFNTNYDHLPTRFPYSVMIDQTRTEQVIREAVSGQGVSIEWSTRLIGLTDNGASITAEIMRADGQREEIRASWLIGSDGGHSTVRKCLGLELSGTHAETWLIADATVHSDLPPDSIYWMRTREGAVMMVPFPDEGAWRLVDTRDVTVEGDLAARFTRKIQAGIGTPIKIEDPTWVSVFTIQERMVPKMRSGRCFIAGDAAHVHSPASGQGLNTGIQEACNLAWKLADVQCRRAGADLLDTYDVERLPVVRELLRSTHFTTRLVQLRGPAAIGLRAMFALVRNVGPLKSRIERKIVAGTSALSLSYAGKPLAIASDTPLAIAVGERVARVAVSQEAASVGWRCLLAELREPGWSLLVFATDDDHVVLRQFADEYEGTIRVRTVLISAARQGAAPGPLPDPDGLLADGLAANPGDWLLIRPDGYLAACGRLGASSPAVAVESLGLRRSS